MAILQETLALLAEAGASISSAESSRLRRLAEDQIHAETVIDERYAAMSRRLARIGGERRR